MHLYIATLSTISKICSCYYVIPMAIVEFVHIVKIGSKIIEANEMGIVIDVFVLL